ncbi:MAG TPA: DUF6142 family protein [Lachnospiraceae bacterium]|nr:DUF6142 family protein [Lachnospiraceae bacterium]
MGRKPNYIFTNKRHSNRAIMSTILGIISIMSLGSVIYLTYAQGGQTPTSYGITGLLIAIYSITGLLLGILTAMEKDRYKLFSCLGIIFNLIAILGIGLVVYVGTFI